MMPILSIRKICLRGWPRFDVTHFACYVYHPPEGIMIKTEKFSIPLIIFNQLTAIMKFTVSVGLLGLGCVSNVAALKLAG